MNSNSVHSSLSANTPARLKNIHQWLVWKSQPRIGQENKFTKVPYNLRTALPSDPKSADTWATFDQVIQATGYDGIGFAINQPIGLLLIDLDNCIVDGVVQAWAEELIQICDTYTEYSPSGRGLHLILEGEKLVDKTRFHHNQIEIYDSKRFLTITGEVYQDQKEINDSTTDLLFQYLQEISPSESVVKAQPSIVFNRTEVNLPLDRAILAKIQTHPEYSQEWSDLSERDACLAGLTNFYTGNNFGQTEQILLATEFCRDKWSQLRLHPSIEDQKITFLRYQIEQNPSHNNLFEGGIFPLYRDKHELHQLLLPRFKEWFQSEDRRIDVVAVTPGGGKTYSATQALVECCREDPSFVGILAQNTNQRVLEEQQSIRDNFGYQALVLQGRNPTEGSNGYCANYAEAERIGQAGLSTSEILCQSACPLRDQCLESGYLSQLNRRSQLYIAPYESAIHWAKHHQAPNVIVFDENPMRPTAIKQKLTLDDLLQYKQDINQLSNQHYEHVIKFIDALKVLIDQHRQIESNRSFKRGNQVVELFQQALDQHLRSLQEQEHEWIDQLNSCSRMIQISNSPSLLVSQTVIDVFSALTFSSLGTEITLEKKKVGSRSYDCCLQLNRFNDYIHQMPDEVNLMVLDAYAEESTFARLFNQQPFQYHRYDIEIDLHITHITRNTNKASLRQMEDQEIERILIKIFQQFNPESLLIYTYKQEVERIKGIVQQIKPGIEVEFSWFYRDRGSNQYKGYQSVMIFGSACPDTDELISELNSQYVQPISDYKENGVYQDYRLRQGIIEKQHHEIKQCIFRVRPTDNPRKAYLFFSNFEIDGLQVDQKINYQEWTGESLSAERREDYQIYYQLIKGVVEEIGFYATHFQSNPELMRQLVEDHDLRDKMEHLIQHSQYGKSFVKLNGEKIRKDLKQIIEKLELTESRMQVYRNWQYETWIKIYSSNPTKLKKLELSNYRIY